MKKNVQENKHLARNMIDKMLLSIRRLNIYILVLAPVVISLFLLGALLMVGNKIYGDEIPEIFQAASGVVFLVVLSLSGVVQIYRREGPGPLGYPVFGVWPVISGYIITTICLVSIIYLFIRIFKLLMA